MKCIVFRTSVNNPTCHLERRLERIIGDSSNGKASYECVRDTRTRQKREDLGSEHRLSGRYKEVGIEIACSLIGSAKGILKAERNKVVDLLSSALVVQGD